MFFLLLRDLGSFLSIYRKKICVHLIIYFFIYCLYTLFRYWVLTMVIGACGRLGDERDLRLNPGLWEYKVRCSCLCSLKSGILFLLGLRASCFSRDRSAVLSWGTPSFTHCLGIQTTLCSSAQDAIFILWMSNWLDPEFLENRTHVPVICFSSLSPRYLGT